MSGRYNCPVLKDANLPRIAQAEEMCCPVKDLRRISNYLSMLAVKGNTMFFGRVNRPKFIGPTRQLDCILWILRDAIVKCKDKFPNLITQSFEDWADFGEIWVQFIRVARGVGEPLHGMMTFRELLHDTMPIHLRPNDFDPWFILALRIVLQAKFPPREIQEALWASIKRHLSNETRTYLASRILKLHPDLYYNGIKYNLPLEAFYIITLRLGDMMVSELSKMIHENPYTVLLDIRRREKEALKTIRSLM